MYSNLAIIIPARAGSTRLINKAVAMIGDKPMIQHVYENAALSGVEHLFIATDSTEIQQAVEGFGGKTIMTGECPTGTDRVFEAFVQLPNKEQIEYIINLQGDMPFINPKDIEEVCSTLRRGKSDMVTLVTPVSAEEAQSHNNVKAVIAESGRALYFSREAVPHNAKEYMYHIGIYGFTSEALKKFVSLEPSKLELQEKLEQLRALENNMSIQTVSVGSIPISVDTAEDLEKAKRFIAK